MDHIKYTTGDLWIHQAYQCKHVFHFYSLLHTFLNLACLLFTFLHNQTIDFRHIIKELHNGTEYSSESANTL